MGLLTTVSASSVLAAGINVTSSADTTADDGVCTLREAITAANTDTASGALTGECAGGSGADTITFSFAGTITLSGLLPAITTDLSISGAGAIIVSGDNAFRVFNVTAGFVALSGLTITAGSVSGGGGGIFNTANLDITDSTISGNTAAGGGGGVWSSGWLGVGDSTISGNSSPGNGGGGIWSVGTLFVMNSTISGNSGALGGGLYNLGNLLMANSTISANSATLSDGGLTAGGSETVVNSIVAGNTAPNSPEFGGDIDGGAVDSVIGVPAGMTLADILVPAGLADNGGPTQTIALALVAGNPAVDTGDATCVEAPISLLDQRGMSRLPVCDIGAYEAQPPTLAAVADIAVSATSTAGAAVSFTSPVGTDEQGGATIVACLPAPGSSFAPGTTTVTCTATDAVGHTASGTFRVIVGAIGPPASATPTSSATPTATPGPLPDTAASNERPGPLVRVLAVVMFALAAAVSIREGVVGRRQSTPD